MSGPDGHLENFGPQARPYPRLGAAGTKTIRRVAPPEFLYNVTHSAMWMTRRFKKDSYVVREFKSLKAGSD
jgi:hypothetical protein